MGLGHGWRGLQVIDGREGKKNRSLLDVGGAVLAVSEFTVYGDVRRGKRPSLDRAGRPSEAEPLSERFVGRLREAGLQVETGRFQTQMEVELVNDGPVTILLDSEKAF